LKDSQTSGGYLMMQLPYLIDITDASRVGGMNRIEVQVWGGQSLIHGVDHHLKQEQDFPADAFDEGKLLSIESARLEAAFRLPGSPPPRGSPIWEKSLPAEAPSCAKSSW
jgi:hypothetical protein